MGIFFSPGDVRVTSRLPKTPVVGKRTHLSTLSEPTATGSQPLSSIPSVKVHLATVDQSLASPPPPNDGTQTTPTSRPHLQRIRLSVHTSPTYQWVTVRKIRPLPPIPSSPSPTTQTPISKSPRSPRPLPSLPPQSAARISTIPDTPPPYSAPQAAISFSLNPRRPPSLSVQTSPDALAPCTTDQSMPSPLTPEMPLAPSPGVIKRRRLSKLRRHLGERVPVELVFPEEHVAAPRLPELCYVEKVQVKARHRCSSEPTFTPCKVFAFDDDSSDDSSDVDHDDYQWTLVNGTTFRVVPVKRYSQKWIREKGGRRWEENDYDDVLRALRSL